MDLGETTGCGTGVEIGGIDPVGIQATCRLEPECYEASELRLEVVHEVSNMVEAFGAIPVHVTVDRRGVVVLLDELDHQVAEVTKGI